MLTCEVILMSNEPYSWSAAWSVSTFKCHSTHRDGCTKCLAEQHCANEAPSAQMSTQNSKFKSMKIINYCMLHVASLGLGIVLANQTI